MTKVRKKFILSIVILILVFNSCERKPSSQRDIVNLIYWSSSNPDEIKMARIQVAEWNQAHPKIQVSLVPLPEDRPAEEIIQAAIEDGTTPDVCSNIWPGAAPQFVDAGGLIAVDKFEDFRKVLGARTPLQMIYSLRHQDGHIYQVPWKGNPIMMEFNVRLLREANIEKPPQTYSEFLKAAKRLTRDTDGDGKIDQWACDPYPTSAWWQRITDFYALYIAASKGHTLLRDGSVGFNNDAAVKVFKFWRDGHKHNYFPKNVFTHDIFIEEKISFHITGPWSIAFNEANKPEDFEYGIVPIPVPDDHEGPIFTYRDSKNISIFSNTSYPREAWEFVKFLISKENDLRLLKMCNQIPLRKDLLTDPELKEYFQNNPMMEKFVAQAVYTRSVDYSLHLQEIFEIISDEFFTSVIQGEKSSQQAVEDAAQKAKRILEEKIGKKRPSIQRGIVNLTYWSSSNPEEINMARIQVAEWNQAHPKIQVSLIPLPEDHPAEEIIQTAIDDGTTPDVCSNIWPGVVPQFVDAGGLIAVDRFEDFMEVMGDRTPLQMIHSLRHQDGHIYQVPWKGNPIMMEYNVRLLREANIEKPPQTYSEFLEAAQKLTRDKNGDGKIDQWAIDPNLSHAWRRFYDFYSFYIAASGGRTLLKDGRVDFDNDYAVTVFQFWAMGYELNYFPKIVFPAGDAFLQGKIAFRITGSWNITHTEKNKPQGFEYDFAPIPVPDDYEGPIFTYRDPKNISIFSTTSHPREAWEFVKYLINKKNDLRLLYMCSQIPLRQDLLVDPEFKEYLQENPIMKKFIEQAVYTKALDRTPHLQKIFEAISQEFVFSTRGEKTPRQAVADAAQKAKRILEESDDKSR